jgi:hypothetical protein
VVGRCEAVNPPLTLLRSQSHPPFPRGCYCRKPAVSPITAFHWHGQVFWAFEGSREVISIKGLFTSSASQAPEVFHPRINEEKEVLKMTDRIWKQGVIELPRDFKVEAPKREYLKSCTDSMGEWQQKMAEKW